MTLEKELIKQYGYKEQNEYYSLVEKVIENPTDMFAYTDFISYRARMLFGGCKLSDVQCYDEIVREARSLK